MKHLIIKLIVFTLTLLIYIFLAGCADEPGDSLYKPETFTTGPAPSITNIETIYPNYSTENAFAGIGVVRITGENFVENINWNFVYFDKEPGIILNASNTELEVKTPNVLGDSVRIKIVG